MRQSGTDMHSENCQEKRLFWKTDQGWFKMFATAGSTVADASFAPLRYTPSLIFSFPCKPICGTRLLTLLNFFHGFVDSSRDGSIDTHRTAYYIYRDYNVCRHRKGMTCLVVLYETKLIAVFFHLLYFRIDNLTEDVCGAPCGYILTHPNIPNPLNLLFLNLSPVR